MPFFIVLHGIFYNLIFYFVGAFLIPYFIVMIIVGIPMLSMEYAVGQYFQIGGVSVFKRLCPMLQGRQIYACNRPIYLYKYVSRAQLVLKTAHA